jgi:LPXTG-motif cell wall-anchored protein
VTQSSNSPAVDAPMRPPRRLALAAVALLALGLTFAWGGGPSDTAHAATVPVDQCNFDETGAAREIQCDVDVVNNIDIATGITSSTVTTTVCAGAPGALTEADCVTTPGATTTDIVGSVNQCNNSVNAGGSIVTCNVSIVNNIVGSGSTTPATVNQCIGSGGGGGTEPTTLCDPVSAASGADIIQCNGSGNGGGASERVQCTVLPSTVSALWPVTIVQCNDSANGGGDLVTCTSRITANIVAPAADTTTTVLDDTTTTTTVLDDTTTTVLDGVPTTISTTTTPFETATTTPTGATIPPELPATGSTSAGILLGALATALGAVALLTTRRRAT